MFEISLWGVMGSMPGASIDMALYGSNTSCMSVQGKNQLVFFDAGTGIVHTQSLTDQKQEVHVVFSHYHYDHILGLPFWSYLYHKEHTIHLYGPTFEGRTLENVIDGLFQPPYLPIRLASIPAKMVYHVVKPQQKFMIGDLEVTPCETDHPGGNMAYRITDGTYRAVYLTDLDYQKSDQQEIIKLCHRAHMVYFDAHFTPKEYGQTRFSGWGHSSIEAAISLRHDASVAQMFLGHYAPHRQPETLEELMSTYHQPGIALAREGLTLRFGEEVEIE